GCLVSSKKTADHSPAPNSRRRFRSPGNLGSVFRAVRPATPLTDSSHRSDHGPAPDPSEPPVHGGVEGRTAGARFRDFPGRIRTSNEGTKIPSVTDYTTGKRLRIVAGGAVSRRVWAAR